MGRVRTVNLDLPPRLKVVGPTYYFDHGVRRGGKRKYENLGQDLKVALKRREKILNIEAGKPLAIAKTHYLYRHYDAAGRLLYIGISLNAVFRLLQHRSMSGWHEEIVKVTIERFPTREQAFRAESKAISLERPLYNVKRPRIDGIGKRLGMGSEALVGAINETQ